MDEFLKKLKEKYIEEVGWSFTFFEGVIFFIYVLAINQWLCGNGHGIWGTLLYISVSKLFNGNGSLIFDVRLLDVFLAIACSLITAITYRKLKEVLFRLFKRSKVFDKYISDLVIRYREKDFGTEAIRFYLSTEAKDEQREYMKKISVGHGFGLISLALMVSSVFSMRMYTYMDIVVFVCSFISLLLILWMTYSVYVEKVIPRIVLEKILRGDELDFVHR